MIALLEALVDRYLVDCEKIVIQVPVGLPPKGRVMYTLDPLADEIVLYRRRPYTEPLEFCRIDMHILRRMTREDRDVVVDIIEYRFNESLL